MKGEGPRSQEQSSCGCGCSGGLSSGDSQHEGSAVEQQHLASICPAVQSMGDIGAKPVAKITMTMRVIVSRVTEPGVFDVMIVLHP